MKLDGRKIGYVVFSFILGLTLLYIPFYFLGNNIPQNSKEIVKGEQDQKQSDKTYNQILRENRRNEDSLINTLKGANLDLFALGIKETNLSEELANNGPYTLFVPRDEAIKSVPGNTLSKFMQNGDKITNTIKNHIVQGELRGGSEKTTSLNGEEISVTTETDGTVRVNGQRVLEGIRYDNGIIYVIDGTILPNQL